MVEETDVTTEQDVDSHRLYTTTDAAVWAEEFCRVVRARGLDIADEGFMTGWFANAIETAKNQGSDRLAQIFERQLDLQRTSFGIDPHTLGDPARDEFIRWNVIALSDELHEALDEVHWKPWASASGWKDRDAYVKELVDALHFLINLFLAAGATPEEVALRYFTKAEVNAARQEVGYDGVSTKCAGCGRAMDEPEIS